MSITLRIDVERHKNVTRCGLLATESLAHTAQNAICPFHHAQKGGGIIGVADDGFVGVTAIGVGFDHRKVEVQAHALVVGVARPCALVAEQGASGDKFFAGAGGEIGRDITGLAIPGGHVGVISPNGFTARYFRQGAKGRVANNNGTAPSFFTGQVAIIGGKNGGNVIGAIGAKDVVARVLVERGGAIIPCHANEPRAGDEHGGIVAPLAAVNLPIGMGGRAIKPCANQPYAPQIAVEIDIGGEEEEEHGRHGREAQKEFLPTFHRGIP